MTAEKLRAVVVTGSSTGIGKTCALTLAREGYRVFAGVRKAADGEALVAEAGPAALTPLMLDVTDAAAIGRAVEEVRAALGARPGEAGRFPGTRNPAFYCFDNRPQEGRVLWS